MTIAIASDHGGYALRQHLKALLEGTGQELVDMGCPSEDSVDYPPYAFRVADAVSRGEADLGILICGTGIGMSLCATRVPGVRAAVVGDTYSARMSREHNDANVLCLGGRTLGPDLAAEIVRVWLATPFSGGERHQRRLAMVAQREGGHTPCCPSSNG